MTWLTTAQGGAERSTLELADGLRTIFGIDVVIVWWDDSKFLSLPRVPHGLRVRQADANSYERMLAHELSSNPEGTVLIGTHRTAMIDIPLANSLNIAVISVLRGMLVANQRLRTVDPERRRLVPRRPDELNWEILARADCWVGVSRSSTASLVELAERPVRAITIYNGVAIAAHPPAFTSKPIRRFSVVARTESWKRIDRVIAAYACLPKEIVSRAQLNIYGNGTVLSQLQKMADTFCLDRNVRFWGHVPDREWLAGTDVLVSACDIEGFGRCVIEAGAAGIPQIVPDRGGSSELVVPGLTGLIYAGGDVRGLTDAMVEAAAWSGNQLAALGQRAHVHARSYSHTRYFMAYARLALQVCALAQRRSSAFMNELAPESERIVR